MPTVTLQPHVGQRRELLPSGTPHVVNVPFAQQEIYLDGVRVGYVGTHAGAPINLIRRYDDATRALIAAAVAEQLGHTPTVNQPDPPAEPPAELDDDDELDDDSE